MLFQVFQTHPQVQLDNEVSYPPFHTGISEFQPFSPLQNKTNPTKKNKKNKLGNAATKLYLYTPLS